MVVGFKGFSAFKVQGFHWLGIDRAYGAQSLQLRILRSGLGFTSRNQVLKVFATRVRVPNGSCQGEDPDRKP